MKGYRAVLKNPPATMIGPPISSWRETKTSAEDAGLAFLIASNEVGDLVIEEADVDWYVVEGQNRRANGDHRVPRDYSFRILLTFREDKMAGARLAIAERLGHADLSVKRIYLSSDAPGVRRAR